MRLRQVVDVSFDELLHHRYDCVLVASGYESRSRFVSQMLSRDIAHRSVILGFQALQDNATRLSNDAFLGEKWGATPLLLDADDEQPIYEILASIGESASGAEFRILVDYSSMSRLWYAAILNWARHTSGLRRVEVDCVYAPGVHTPGGEPAVIREIASIPGCEGEPRGHGKSIGIFGLGFDGFASLCVYDQLEPDETYVFLADPAGRSDYPEIVVEQNRTLIDEHAALVLHLPLASVEQTYRYLAELVQPYRGSGDVTLVPMGPKPHVLASILLAHRFREVTCLRVSTHARAVDIEETGDLICSRVEFQGDDQVTRDGNTMTGEALGVLA